MPGASATSFMPAASVRSTTARTQELTAGAISVSSAAKEGSAKRMQSFASVMMKAMSSVDRRGFTVWQTAPMPETP